MPDWKTAFEKELQLAIAARERGNEGQARVCARRAAGVVIREYFARQGFSGQAASAYDLLQALQVRPETPAEARQSAAYLTLRVDETFKLPAGVDLVEIARELSRQLIPGETNRPNE